MLTYAHIGIYSECMARVATTHDVFNAVAEPKRRTVLSILAGRKLSVNSIVEQLDWPQPQVSKHLSVLRKVGLVAVERSGRQQLYSVNGVRIKAVYDWARHFESFWTDHLLSIKESAELRTRKK